MTSIEQQLANGMAESKPMLVEFYATWCPHCQRMMPVVEELKKHFGDRCNVVQIDAEKYEALAREYKVETYPTWYLFKDGQVFWHDAGEKPLSELEDMVNRVI